MVETYTLKTSLEETRRELSQALYQNDAAVRVIARLTMERDQARAMLAQGGGGGGAAPAPSGGDAMEVEKSGSSAVPASALEVMTSTWNDLCKERKERKGAAGKTTRETVSGYAKKSSKTIHKSSGKTGINAVACCKANPDLIATGGVDKQVIVFNTATEKVVATKAAGSKPVNAVDWLDGSSFVSGSGDGVVKLFGGENFDEVATAGVGETVVAVDVHPSGKYVFACTGSDVSILDAGDLGVLARLGDGETDNYTRGGLHPDGLIYVAGTDKGDVHVWDVKSGSKAASLEVSGPVGGVAFSDNGYHLAVGGDDGATIFDMRKQKVIGKAGSGRADAVAWEGEGKMLAYSQGGKTMVVEAKKWEDVVVTCGGHGKDVRDIAWGEVMVTVGMDRKVIVFGK
jgi:pre-mRNA-processing factor 19